MRRLQQRGQLASLIPKSRANLTRFHGVFAPNSKHSIDITPAKRGKGHKKPDGEWESKTQEEKRQALTEGVSGANVALRLLKETGVCTIARDDFGQAQCPVHQLLDLARKNRGGLCAHYSLDANETRESGALSGLLTYRQKATIMQPFWKLQGYYHALYDH